jgi:hypothetical protein
MFDVAAASSISMSHIGEVRPRGLLASKTEDFFDSRPLPVRKVHLFGAAPTAIRNPSMIGVRVALAQPQMAETYFL